MSVLANVFSVISVLSVLTTWFLAPSYVSYVWILMVCSAPVLLLITRRRPLPKIWLLTLFVLSFPLCYSFFFDKICSAAKVKSLDEFLWVLDGCFGYVQPHLTRFLLSLPGLYTLCQVSWFSLPFFFICAYLTLPKFVQTKYLQSIVCIGCVITPMYMLCPGAGPKYLFHSYPETALVTPHPISLAAGIQLNTTPSGHFTWALIMFCFSYKYCRKWVSAIFGAVVVLTIAATLGLGEHYVIDLILSVPYAAAVWAFVVQNQRKRGVLLLLVVVIWLVAIRTGWALLLTPSTVLLLCVGTIFCSLFRIPPRPGNLWVFGKVKPLRKTSETFAKVLSHLNLVKLGHERL